MSSHDPAESFTIIDCHHHVGSLEALGIDVGSTAAGEDPTTVDRDRRLRAMGAHGIEQAVLIPGHAYLRPSGVADTRRVNDEVAAYRDADPDHFPAALGVVEPLHGDAGRQELERMRDELDLRGVSIHARFQGVSTDSPLVIALVRRAVELGLVPFIHAVEGVPDEALWRVQQVARAVPDAPVVVLDALSGPEHARQAVVVAADTPNVVFDVSLANHFLFVEALLEEAGSDRLLFGSDYYSMMGVPDHVPALRELLTSSLSVDEKQAILGGNVTRLLHIGA